MTFSSKSYFLSALLSLTMFTFTNGTRIQKLSYENTLI